MSTATTDERCSCGATFGGTWESTRVIDAASAAKVAAEHWRETHLHGAPAMVNVPLVRLGDDGKVRVLRGDQP